MKIVGKYKSGDGTKFFVVDVLAHRRTIMLLSFNVEFFSIKLPHLRFLIGYDKKGRGKSRVFHWNRQIYLYGSVEPFGNNLCGFAMPLPNFSRQGRLSCVGSMSISNEKTPEDFVIAVLQSFWGSTFYSWFDRSFPREGKANLLSLQELSVDWDYGSFPEALFSGKVEWTS